MYFFTLVDRFKSLDIYRKLPNDFVQPTYSGALRKKTLSKLLYCLIKYFYNYSINNQCHNNAFIINE